jgi:hypothetical protein
LYETFADILSLNVLSESRASIETGKLSGRKYQDILDSDRSIPGQEETDIKFDTSNVMLLEDSFTTVGKKSLELNLETLKEENVIIEE